MLIAWLNDYSVEEMQGGCNITGGIMIKKGVERKHEIHRFTPKNIEGVEFSKFDLLILNNINNFKLEFIEEIIANHPYVKYEHDYCFCKKRNALCNPRCSPAPIFTRLFSNSKLNIFFSPLQLKIFKEVFGETMRDAITIPAPIEEDKWFADPHIQQEAYLFFGMIATHKGIHQILDFADSQKGTGKVFHFAGKPINKVAFKRIKENYHYLGEIPHEEVPKLLRKYKYVLTNPQCHETFGTTILEAMMSGCTVVKFSKSFETGLESYNLSPKQIMDKSLKASSKFWKTIEALNVTET